MKLVLVISLTAALGMGFSSVASAHHYGGKAGGSFYWADSGYVIGFNYGAPYAAPWYVPPPPRYYGRGYRAPRYGYHGGKRHGYKHGYRKGYKKGYRKGHRQGRRHHDDRYYGDY